MQFLIALDQLVNCCFWHRKEGFGMADETLSARCWRLRNQSRFWGIFRSLVDTLFWWQDNHCEQAYQSEFERRHLPGRYRTSN